MSLIKEVALISLTPTADHSASEGCFVKHSSGQAALVSATTDVPIGVIVDGEDTSGKDTIAVGGPYPGTVHVKLSATVAQGGLLQLAANGTCIADAGTGARIIVGRALEAGVSGDLVESVLWMPDPRT